MGWRQPRKFVFLLQFLVPKKWHPGERGQKNQNTHISRLFGLIRIEACYLLRGMRRLYLNAASSCNYTAKGLFFQLALHAFIKTAYIDCKAALIVFPGLYGGNQKQ